MRGQLAGSVEDIACGIKTKVTAGLQAATGIVERLRGGGHLMTALCGTCVIVPVASLYGEGVAGFQPAVRVT